MDELCFAGVEPGGPNSFGAKESEKFVNELDKILAKHRA